MKVAVYGTLKKGYNNHYLLERSRFVGKGKTGQKFTMECVGFPVVSTKPQHCVSVEIYEVNRATLRQLDRLEGNGRMYQRKRCACWIGKKRVIAWMYIGTSIFDERPMRKVEPEGDTYVWPDKDHYSRRAAA